MREIKFRAIRKGSKEFLFGDLVHNCEDDAIFPSVLDDNAMLNSPDYYTVDSETIGQFTGLRDKNGKEIYEGDLIKAENYHYVFEIKFEDFQFIAVHYNNPYGKWGPINRFGELDFEIEVIGNIQQNQ